MADAFLDEGGLERLQVAEGRLDGGGEGAGGAPASGVMASQKKA